MYGETAARNASDIEPYAAGLAVVVRQLKIHQLLRQDIGPYLRRVRGRVTATRHVQAISQGLLQHLRIPIRTLAGFVSSESHLYT